MPRETTRQQIKRLRRNLRQGLQPQRQTARAIITSPIRDGQQRVTGALATVDGSPNTKVQMDHGASCGEGDVWEVVNFGSETAPAWVARRKVRSIQYWPEFDPLATIPVPTGLDLETGYYFSPWSGGGVGAWVYATWKIPGIEYGPLEYEVQVATNDQIWNPTLYTTKDDQPRVAIAKDISDTDTIIPREPGNWSYRQDMGRAGGRIQIESEFIDYDDCTWDEGDTGFEGVGAADSFSDATGSWITRQFINFCLVDSAGDFFHIENNTKTTLTLVSGSGTPANGTYSIHPAWTGCTRGAGTSMAAAHVTGKIAANLSWHIYFNMLRMDEDYNIRIRARNAAGAVSAWTNWASITSAMVPEGMQCLTNADFERRLYEFVEERCDWWDGGGSGSVEHGAYGLEGGGGYRLSTYGGDIGFPGHYAYIGWPHDSIPGGPPVIPAFDGELYTASLYVRPVHADSGDPVDPGDWQVLTTYLDDPALPPPAGKLTLHLSAGTWEDSSTNWRGFGADVEGANVIDVGDGWFRIAVTGTLDAQGLAYLSYILYVHNEIKGSNIFIYADRPQLELGTLSPWTPSLIPSWGSSAWGLLMDSAGIGTADGQLWIGPGGYAHSDWTPGQDLTFNLGQNLPTLLRWKELHVGHIYCEDVFSTTPLGAKHATLIVAASNSHEKDKAHYICDGYDDHSTVGGALATVTPSGFKWVHMLEGDYHFGGGATLPENSKLSGAGAGLTRIHRSGGAGATFLVNDNTELCDFSVEDTDGKSVISRYGSLDNLRVHDIDVMGGGGSSVVELATSPTGTLIQNVTVAFCGLYGSTMPNDLVWLCDGYEGVYGTVENVKVIGCTASGSDKTNFLRAQSYRSDEYPDTDYAPDGWEHEGLGALSVVGCVGRGVVRVERVSGVSIAGNFFEKGNCVRVDDCCGVSVTGNVMHGEASLNGVIVSGNSMWEWELTKRPVSGIEIVGNTFSHCIWAVSLRGPYYDTEPEPYEYDDYSMWAVVGDNTFESCEVGLSLSTAADVQINNNILDGC